MKLITRIFGIVLIGVSLVSFLPKDLFAEGNPTYCDSTVEIYTNDNLYAPAGEWFDVGFDVEWTTYEPVGGRNDYDVMLERIFPNPAVLYTYHADTDSNPMVSYGSQPYGNGYYPLKPNPTEPAGLNQDGLYKITATHIGALACPGGNTVVQYVNYHVQNPPAGTCNVTTPIYADDTNPQTGTATNLHFTISGNYNWSIVRSAGSSGTVFPTSGNDINGDISTGNLTVEEPHTYQLWCENAYTGYSATVWPTTGNGGGYSGGYIDNASLYPDVPLPTYLNPGDVFNFTIGVQNRGNTWWYHGDAYKLRQSTNLNISSTNVTFYGNSGYGPSFVGLNYGHLPERYNAGDVGSWSFNLTAPATPGAYSLNMGMVHSAWYDYILDADHTQRGGGPSTDDWFSNLSQSFIVIGPPTVNNVTISSPTVTADDSTTYTISVTTTSSAGVSAVTHNYALINYQGANGGQYRGYLVWYGPADAWTGTPGIQDVTSCTGSGGASDTAAVYPGYGEAYIRLVSCNVTDSGNSRTTTYTVKFKPAFTSPLTDNDISGYGCQTINGSAAVCSGWTNFDINFGLTPVDGAQFVSQTINGVAFNNPGGSITLQAGLTYPVTITYNNNGTSVWTAGYPYGVGLIDASTGNNGIWVPTMNRSRSATNVNPSTPETFSFNITAPPAPTTSTWLWQMVKDGVAWFGDQTPSVAITVVSCATDCSQYMSHTINGVLNPTSITLYSGQSYSANVIMKNIGSNTWTGSGNPKYRLGTKLASNVNGSGVVVNVPGGGVGANATRTFDTSFTAPAVGTYTYKWQMMNNTSSNNTPASPAFFGAVTTPDVTVTVVPPPPTTPTGLTSSCNAPGDQVTLSWASQVWATSYTVQIGGMAPVTQAGTTYGPAAITPNQNYTWTVYATNSTASSAAANGSFRCPDLFTVTVTNPITGGTVQSTSPNSNINCGTTCSAQYLNGSTVILQALPSSSYWQFNGWSGDCSGIGICSLIINSAKNATASFIPRSFNYIEF